MRLLGAGCPLVLAHWWAEDADQFWGEEAFPVALLLVTLGSGQVVDVPILLLIQLRAQSIKFAYQLDFSQNLNTIIFSISLIYHDLERH